MNLDLENKTAWVLGGGSGLGRSVAIALAREGARVWISGRSQSRLDATAEGILVKGGACTTLVADITDPMSLDAAHARIVAETGGVDVLIVNGGGPPAGPVVPTPLPDVDAAYRLLLRPGWQLANLVAPGMTSQGSGVIIFVTSSSTREVIANLSLSNVFRAGVVGLAKTLAQELGPAGVRVLCVAPGRIDTERVRGLDVHRAEVAGTTVEAVQQKTRDAIALRRYGVPDEFGAVVAMLASPKSSYVSGVTLSVDGGLLRSLHA